MDLALNNLQRLICHQTKPNQPTKIKIRLMFSIKFYVFQFLIVYFFKYFLILISNLELFGGILKYLPFFKFIF